MSYAKEFLHVLSSRGRRDVTFPRQGAYKYGATFSTRAR